VIVAGDLQHAKIYVSIYGTEEARAETMAGLKSATGYVRSSLGQNIGLRRTPEVIFLEDRSLERGTQMLTLINSLSAERVASGMEAKLDAAALAEKAEADAAALAEAEANGDLYQEGSMK
jgi:ribosome-binding factor A